HCRIPPTWNIQKQTRRCAVSDPVRTSTPITSTRMSMRHAASVRHGRITLQMSDTPGDVTLLLAEMKRGNSEALPKLIPLVYQELKRLAVYFLQSEREGHTLQATALVNEAYLRLAGQRASFQNRAQFMGVAAQLMRRILVDYARQRVAAKRGGHE